MTQGSPMTSPKKEWLDAWHVNPSINKEYDLIDGLRGIAILLVVACHMVYVNPNSSSTVQFLGGLFSAGSNGVTVFFTLSGFLISWPFWKRKVNQSAQVVPPGYGWRRFWKIYPPLALSLVLLTPIYLLRTHDGSFIELALQWLMGLPLVMPVSGKLNPVMWSLVVEMHFYIVLPLLFICLRKVPAKACLWILLLAFLLVPVLVRWVNISRGVYFSLLPEIQVHFPALLDAFAFGVFLAGLDNLKLIKKAWVRFGDLGFVLLGGSFILSSWLTLNPVIGETMRLELVGWGVKISTLFLLCYIADPQHPRARLLSQPWLRWCGIISYEWYLFHQPILTWIKEAFGPAGGNLIKYLVILGCSLFAGLILAAVVYRWFSLPILKYGRDRNRADQVKKPVNGGGASKVLTNS